MGIRFTFGNEESGFDRCSSKVQEFTRNIEPYFIQWRMRLDLCLIV